MDTQFKNNLELDQEYSLESHQKYFEEEFDPVFFSDSSILKDMLDDMKKIPERNHQLECSVYVTKKIMEILEQVVKKDSWDFKLHSKGNAVTAGVQYIAGILTNEGRTQAQVAEAYETNSAAIKKVYKELTEKLGLDIML